MVSFIDALRTKVVHSKKKKKKKKGVRKLASGMNPQRGPAVRPQCILNSTLAPTPASCSFPQIHDVVSLISAVSTSPCEARAEPFPVRLLPSSVVVPPSPHLVRAIYRCTTRRTTLALACSAPYIAAHQPNIHMDHNRDLHRGSPSRLPTVNPSNRSTPPPSQVLPTFGRRHRRRRT